MEKDIKYKPESVTSRHCGVSMFSLRKGLPTSFTGVKTKIPAVSMEYSCSGAWVLNWNNGNMNNNNKNNNNRVRPVSASLEETIHACVPVEDVFEAYYDCRKNKRKTVNAIAFEVNYEENCVRLWEEINSYSYVPNRSISFIITHPVQREVFAADFRDRVIHHLIAKRIEPLLESVFIDETSNCRKGKGVHYGIRTLDSAIKICSDNYKKDCWILKLDIKSFFMSIDKALLCKQLTSFIKANYLGNDIGVLLYLIETTIMSSPEKNCVRRSPVRMWKGLPSDKSLFSCGEGYGIPIGNLTSQMEANFFLNGLDHFIKEKFKHYGRYVDDFYIVNTDKDRLKSFITDIKEYLLAIGLILHPNKIYLQHYTKGVKYIGAVIRTNRIYIANRTRSNMYKAIHLMNMAVQTEGYAEDNAEHFACCLNSYLGLMKHYSTYGLRRRAMRHINSKWWKVAYVSGHFEKISIKNKYKKINKTKKQLQ